MAMRHNAPVADTEPLSFLTAWFARQSDGDWEHDLGIKIETLDNPGWAVDIRLADTELDGTVIDWQRADESDDVWLHWRSTGDMFEARCGPSDWHGLSRPSRRLPRPDARSCRRRCGRGDERECCSTGGSYSA